MNKLREEFYVVLPSNSCPDTQPNNNSSKFIVDYPNSFRLEDPNWEVALTEFNCLYSHADTLGDIFLKYKTRGDVQFPTIFFLKHKEFKYSSSNVSISAKVTEKKHLAVTFIKPFYLKFKTNDEAESWGFEHRIVIANEGHITGKNPIKDGNFETDLELCTKGSVIEDTEYTMSFNEEMVFNHNDDLEEYFQKYCKHIFTDFEIGRDRKISFLLEDDVKEITMDNKLAKLLGYKETRFVNNHQMFLAPEKPKIKGTFDSFFIYSNIVEPIYVGNTLVPLLRNIWVENKREMEYGDVIYQSFDPPMYLPVASTLINKIEINIRGDSGKLINFIPNSKTSITLHFRKNV